MILLRDPKYQDRRYDRQIRTLRWLCWGLSWMLAGLILGKLIL
jgi:hypothetical protein